MNTIGFIITTASGIDENLLEECKRAIEKLEVETAKTFGESYEEQPETSQLTSLLLCVRSGEEKIKLLNLGMSDAVVRDISMSTGIYIMIACDSNFNIYAFVNLNIYFALNLPCFSTMILHGYFS